MFVLIHVDEQNDTAVSWTVSDFKVDSISSRCSGMSPRFSTPPLPPPPPPLLLLFLLLLLHSSSPLHSMRHMRHSSCFSSPTMHWELGTAQPEPVSLYAWVIRQSKKQSVNIVNRESRLLAREKSFEQDKMKSVFLWLVEKVAQDNFSLLNRRNIKESNRFNTA